MRARLPLLLAAVLPGLACVAAERDSAAVPAQGAAIPSVVYVPAVLAPLPAFPAATAPAAAPAAPEIPVPPAEDASEPERIVHYFCRAWKDWDFAAMYGAMAADYREQMPFRRFEALFKGDVATNGGLLDESIEAEPAGSGGAVRLKVALRFRNAHAAPRTAIAVAVREGAAGWRIGDSGIIPPDLDNL